MKKIVTIVVVFTLAALFSLPSKTLAAAGDTLIVYASGANLETVINNDITAEGLQNHKVYKLVTLDSTYIFQGPVSVKSDITVIGVLGSNGRPPCIQPMTLLDGSLPNNLFLLQGSHTKAIFKNLYLTGRSIENTIPSGINFYNGAGALIQVAAAGIRLTVDNVVFCDWPTNNIGYSADSCSIFVTNCKFRNGNVSVEHYSGEAVRNTFNSASSDTLVMKYNTMFCMAYSALCPVTVNPVNYLEFSHNSVIYTYKNPFWIVNLTNGKVNNNLFYATFAGASTWAEYYQMWDQLRSIDIAGVVDFDTLNLSMAKWLDPADSTGATGILWPAEAKRTVEVKNNVCFWPTAITNLWTAWNDTAHVDTVVTPVWMNARTIGMFADKTHWPGFVESGNMSVNPQFGPSIDSVLSTAGTGNGIGTGVGFLDYFRTCHSGSAEIQTFGYKLETVVGNWVPEWPLPEVVDMQYANTALRTGGTDGKPIGDPYWFNNGPLGVEKTQNQMPGKFVLENAYPNPFNPTTTIKFTLPQRSGIRLVLINILGQEVKEIVSGNYSAGSHQVTLDASRLASGIYFYKLQAGSFSDTKKLVLLK